MDTFGFKKLNYKRIKQNTYLINEYGDVYSIPRKRLLTKGVDKDGYYDIALQSNKGGRVTYRIATLVLVTFVGLPPNEMIDVTVNHIDGDRVNNHYSNLEWMDRGLNSSIGKIKLKGELNNSHILTEKEVLEICELLLENKLNLKDIGKIYNVDKTTISNIKRKKSWIHITKNYSFKIKSQKNRSESKKQREQILKLIMKGARNVDIIKLGYPKSVVYRVRKTYKESKSTINNQQ